MHFIPWIHYFFFGVGFSSLILLCGLVLVVFSNYRERSIGWLIAIDVLFGIFSFVSLYSLDSSHPSQAYTLLKIRFMMSIIMYVVYCGFLQAYLQPRVRWLFPALAAFVLIPILLAAIQGLDFLRGPNPNIRFAWGESIFSQGYLPSKAMLIHRISFVIVAIAGIGIALTRVFRGQDKRRHWVLIAALSTMLIISIISVIHAKWFIVPIVPLASLGFMIVIGATFIGELARISSLSQAIIGRDTMLRNMASQVPGVLYSLRLHPDGRHEFLYLSERCYDLLGFRNDDPDPMGAFARGLSPVDLQRYVESEQEAVRTVSSWQFTAPFHRDDGRVVWFQGLSIMSLDGLAVQSNGVLLDITDRVASEEDRELLVADLAMRREELESFLFSMSHDLRAPLVNILGYAGETIEMMKGLEPIAPRIAEDSKQHLNVIVQNASKLHGQLTQMVELGRQHREVLNIEGISIQMILDHLNTTDRYQDPTIKWNLQADLPMCRGDRANLEQAFRKILDNCLDYRKPSEILEITLRAEQKGNAVVYEIRDNGIGFLQDHAQGMFKAFHQLQPHPGHFGMGLTIANLLIRQMGGRIWAEGRLGQGASFFISLPRFVG